MMGEMLMDVRKVQSLAAEYLGNGETKHVFLSQPLRFDAITARSCLRVWTGPGESHLVPSGWLRIPKGGFLVIECQ